MRIVVESKIEYPEFTPRKYGLIRTSGRENALFVSPAEFFLGHVLTASPELLTRHLASWQRYKKSSKDFKVELFPLDRDYLVWTGERKQSGQKQRRRKKLLDLAVDDALVCAVLDKIQTRDGNTNIWDYHGHTDPNRRAITQASGHSKKLSGRVKHCGDKRDSDHNKFHFCHVDGPYVDSKPRFNNLYCSCEDFGWINLKRGDSVLQPFCKHLAALLEYVSSNPRAMQTFLQLKGTFRDDRRKLNIASPFHTDFVRKETLEWFPADKLPYIARGKQPPLRNLMMDAFLAHYIEGQSLVELNKKLLRLPVFDSDLIREIYDNTAKFEVIPGSQLFGVESNVNPEVKKFYRNNLRKSLEKNGFVLDGYAYEKKDSVHEVVAMNFAREDSGSGAEIRVLFSHDYPPVLVRRTPMDRARTRPFDEPDPEKQRHPFSELYMPKRVYDDKHRKNTDFVVELPRSIPDEFALDYALCIEEHFHNGIEGLIDQVETLERARVRNVQLPRVSQLYFLQKVLRHAG